MGGVAEKLVGRILGSRASGHRLHVGRLKASGRVRELHKLLLEARGASKSMMHRPCRRLGGSEATIYRACPCLEASGGFANPIGPGATHVIVGGLGPPKAT